jgi:hypothetical protein
MSHSEEQLPTAAEARRTWTAPSVRRISAGSAEDGGGETNDGGLPS